MASSAANQRTPKRRARDEQLAAEHNVSPLELPRDATPAPVEAHLRRRRPVAVAGTVENGLVRPLDPAIKLPEHAHVIIVATEQT